MPHFARSLRGISLRPPDSPPRPIGFLSRVFRGRLQNTLDSALENGLQRLKAEAERQQLES
jgi:hypothetical protein